MGEEASASTRGEYRPETEKNTDWRFKSISGLSKSDRIIPGIH